MPLRTFFNIEFLALIMLSASFSFGQSPSKLSLQDLKKLSNEVTFEGNLKKAVQWRDKENIHVIITTETGNFENKSNEHPNEGLDAQLYAYHYVIRDSHAELVWKVTDYIKDCPVDIEARFLENTLQITDLDKDGVKEVWLMYVTVCHGDVSPLDMKIIMYEGAQKYAMRGQNRIKFSAKENIGGEYKFDKAFNEASPLFRSYAKKMWQKNISGR